MQHLEVSCAVRRLFKSLVFKGLKNRYRSKALFLHQYASYVWYNPRFGYTVAIKSLLASTTENENTFMILPHTWTHALLQSLISYHLNVKGKL